MINLICRGQYESPGSIQREFEHLIARLRGFLSQSFDENGDLIVADPNLAVKAVGEVSAFCGTVAPAGHLLCDGSQVSRVKYKSLYDVVGTTWGVGDGTTTFNVPDLRQRFLLGKAAAGTGSALGATGGAIDHTHTGPSHTHTVPAIANHQHGVSALQTTEEGAHDHGGTESGGGDSTGSSGAHDHGGATGSHTHDEGTYDTDLSGTSGTAGAGFDVGIAGNHAHNVQGESGSSTASISSDGSHTHTTSAHVHDVAEDGAHQHTLTGSVDAAGAVAEGTSGASGTGNTGTANPPYAVVNYIIFTGVA